MKRALITGITGQDGSILAEQLLGAHYEVFGMARRDSWCRPNNASHLEDKVHVVLGDMANGTDIATAIRDIKPDEVYNLASQSRPGESWAIAPETLTINGMGAVHLFEAIRHTCPAARVYHASSSEMFGRAVCKRQNENTPFNPANPYAAAKVYAHNMVRIYRESFGLFISSGIMFNHESERRQAHFVTQKIAYGAACAATGIVESPELNERGQPVVLAGKLSLGNLEVSRDWGYAPDFVVAMRLILQHHHADDFVIGTGQLHTIKELCNAAYARVGLDWHNHVVSDQSLVRPVETGQNLADASKARKLLGWKPTVSFNEMIGKMVDAQLLKLSRVTR